MLLGILVYILVRRPDIVDRIRTMKIFGAEINLERIEKSIGQAVSKIENLESKFDHLKDDYINKSVSKFDPIAPASDLHALGSELKSIAAALDDIDFVESYLNTGATPDQVYAAGCAIQVRPQPKFLSPLIRFIEQISTDPKLGGIRPAIGYKLLQCFDNILSTDNKREQSAIETKDIGRSVAVLEAFAKHPICDADRPTNGKKGIPDEVARLSRKFNAQIKKRENNKSVN